MSSQKTTKKPFQMPHTFVIIGIIILAAVVLTWLIPAGEYVRFENEAGVKVIDPEQFQYIAKTQVNPLLIPLYIVQAFIKRIDLMLVILLGGAIGFSTGPLNINTTIVAQKIAGLPLYSGVVYRFVCFGVFYVVTNMYLIRYAMKVHKHPELSPVYDIDQQSDMKKDVNLDEFGTMDLRKILIMLSFFASLVAIVYGGIKLDWDMEETASIFLGLAIVVGALGGFGPSRISREFLEGCKKMLSAAFIIGMAQAISGIMNAGHITDTVVHVLAGGLSVVPSILQAPAMLIANTIINVFLTSGSGQAAAVIPIMAPLADLVGMTRQTAVLAFNFGDGFCNYVLPTSTALMGIISAVNIPYDRWMRFMWKLYLIWMVVGSILLMVAHMIHFGPM